jgi:hypothetical protein
MRDKLIDDGRGRPLGTGPVYLRQYLYPCTSKASKMRSKYTRQADRRRRSSHTSKYKDICLLVYEALSS